MSSLNKVQLIGRIGFKPKFVQNEKLAFPTTNFSLATSEKWKVETGDKKERVTWHQLVAYRNTATYIVNYLNVGDLVYIEGKLNSRSYEKDDEKRYTTEIIVTNIQILNSKSKKDNSELTKDTFLNSEPDFNDNIPL